ncbi:transcription regulatory protein [Escherichia coli]|uniref:Transcription regulatory protein n=2 Tax=Enterobacteriaceae TaxID=543 RepID=A0A376P4T9_ECOLX|nr:transcription regulatory protein [Escherichia coli]
MLNELWELKKAGFVDKSVYTWRVADNNVQQEQPEQAELPEETTTATVAKISECDLTATIEQRGPQTADELATFFGITSRKVASTLAMAISKGRLIRVNQNGKFRYCMPGDNLPAEPKAASVAETDGKAFPQPAGVALPVQEAATQEDIKTETVADIVQSLPSFTETQADDLVLPSLHMANRELRRAKNHVQKWERVCAALRELKQAPGYCPTDCRFLQSYCVGKVIAGGAYGKVFTQEEREKIKEQVVEFGTPEWARDVKSTGGQDRCDKISDEHSCQRVGCQWRCIQLWLWVIPV